MNTVEQVCQYIKTQSGITVVPCEHFTGFRTHQGVKFVNVIAEKRVSESRDFDVLASFAMKSKVISRVEPNGVNRLAIFLK